MTNLVIDFLIGVAGYQFKKWFGDELMKYLIRPIFRRVLRPVLAPIGRFLRARVIKTEHQAELFIRSRQKAAKKHMDPSDIDSVTL